MDHNEREKLGKIRRELASASPTAYVYIDHVGFLLSLIDSQKAVTLIGPCVACGHNKYNAESGECEQRWMEGRQSVICGCPCAKRNSITNAATRMRDLCVEKVKTMPSSFAEDDYRAGCLDREDVITEIQSLTLDNGDKDAAQTAHD